MRILHHSPVFTLTLLLSPCLANAGDKNISELVLAQDVKWGYLNPLRGDKSPGAADLWGDRTKNVATGMLVRFNKGFSSPPHIHNISYRGVVISGQVHNDDPKAEKMWLPTGSYWTQPAGENHITAANGDVNLIYLEIDNGPYLVEPSDRQFDNGERPINVHASNLVWLDQKDSVHLKSNDVEIAQLWESNESDPIGGALVKLSAGFNGILFSDATEFRVVVIDGSLVYDSSETAVSKNLLSGSYFSSKGKFQHKVSASKNSIIYVRSNKEFQITSSHSD